MMNDSLLLIIDATLCFRGYTIEQLAESSNFEEVVYLLWNDRLPNQAEYDAFAGELRKRQALKPETVEQLEKLPTEGVHPMAWLRTAVSAMALWDKEAQDMSEEANFRKGVRLSAKMGSLVATFHRLREGLQLKPPNPDKGVAWNFLYQLKGEVPETLMLGTTADISAICECMNI